MKVNIPYIEHFGIVTQYHSVPIRVTPTSMIVSISHAKIGCSFPEAGWQIPSLYIGFWTMDDNVGYNKPRSLHHHHESPTRSVLPMVLPPLKNLSTSDKLTIRWIFICKRPWKKFGLSSKGMCPYPVWHKARSMVLLDGASVKKDVIRILDPGSFPVGTRVNVQGRTKKLAVEYRETFKKCCFFDTKKWFPVWWCLILNAWFESLFYKLKPPTHNICNIKWVNLKI